MPTVTPGPGRCPPASGTAAPATLATRTVGPAALAAVFIVGVGGGVLLPSPAGAATSHRIHDIQGTAHRSPVEGASVTQVPGVVTAVRADGFFFEDTRPDDDPRTSEGLFVFTDSAPTVAVGNAALVSGRVAEFRPGGPDGTNNLTQTEITTPGLTVRVVSTDNPLPETVVGGSGRQPPTTVIEDDASGGDVENPGGIFDVDTDGLDFWESLEGMRLSVPGSKVVGPANDFGEVALLPDGIPGASVLTPRGGILVRAEDFNPERLIADDELLRAQAMPAVQVGDSLMGLIGVLDYSFGNFKLHLTSLPTVLPGALAKETALDASANQLSVATFNVENLDPGDPQDRFDRLGATVVKNLRSPDLLTIEEVQDNNGAVNDTVVDAAQTWDKLIAAISAAGGPAYQYRQIDPVDDADGGEPGGNIRVGFLFRTDRGLSFVDRPGGNSTGGISVQPGPALSASPGRIDPANAAFADSRKPLAGEFRWKGRTIFAIGVHFNSKGGDQPLFGRFQPPVLSSEAQRLAQATVVRDFVRQLMAVDSTAAVVVLGDVNDFEFSPVAGVLEDGGNMVALMKTLPLNDRYSYVFEGNSQTLDQMFVTASLAEGAMYDSVHLNSEFTDQLSDHDPQLARFELAAGPGRAVSEASRAALLLLGVVGLGVALIARRQRLRLKAAASH